jgi:hypothetical protein
VIEDDKLATTDDDIIAEAKAFRENCIAYNSENVRCAKDDLRFLAGGDGQWNDAEIASRVSSGRPIITINKIPTFLHQVTNDQLENQSSIKVHPVDDYADVETAKVISGLIKNIEYSSNADVAYDTAVNFAAGIGFGYYRIVTDYVNEKSFDQEICFERIANPFSVHFDYSSKEIDGSDQFRCLIESAIDRKQFKYEYPKSKIDGNSFIDNDWVKDNEVIIGEYYRIECKPDTLILLSNGEAGLKSDLQGELPVGVTIVQQRPSEKRKVMLYKLTGHEILERTEIKCRWIPVFPVYGNEINIDGKIIRSGIIRNAKDPAKLYNYFWTSAAEEINSRTKTPWVMAEGQDEGHENEWRFANRVTLSRLIYKPTTYQGQLVPPPQRQPMADFPSGLMGMAMQANDDIKATTGLFDASLGARGNATSGRQELAQQRQGDLANFHYTDNANKTKRHAGRCILDMIPHYYDAERVVRILGEDGEFSHAKINEINPNPQPDPETGAIQTVLNDMSVGEYDVTISTGPSYQTQRQESAESMLAMAQNYPQLMDVAGDMVVKSLDWPNAEDIAERIKKAMPPELTADPDEDPAQLPPEAMQAMQQDHEQMQLLQQQNALLMQEIEKAKAANDSKERIAAAKNENTLDVAELKGLIDLLKAQIQPPPQLSAAVDKDLT